MTRRYLAHAAAPLILAGLAAPAAAQTTVLDFAGSICGPAGDQACGDGSQIGQNYGDRAGVDISYRSVTEATGATLEPFLKHWTANYGDLRNVVWGGSVPTGQYSEMTFTALAGFELSLRGFDGACYLNRASCQTFPYALSEIGDGAVASGSIAAPANGSVGVTLNTSYSRDGFILRWGPDGYDGGLDNIAFDVRAIAGGGVPEPATWATMILGFGVVGGSLRRRRSQAALAL